MKGKEIVLDQISGRKAAACVVDGVMHDFIVDPGSGEGPVPGTIFRALPDRPVKGQGGQFVRLPDGLKGFLRGTAPFGGKSVLVQVTGVAEPGKAVPVTAKLLFKGRFGIVTPMAPGINVSRRIKDEDRRTELTEAILRACPDVTGAIVRSCAEHVEAAEVAQDIADLNRQWIRLENASAPEAPELLSQGPDAHAFARREWHGVEPVVAPFADHGIDELLDEISHAHINLAGGASAWIEPTRALVAIDVNTGGDSSPAAGLKANIALARDLPRQLRCRGLGGQITIDFAPFPKRERRQVEQALRRAFQADQIETALVGWTPLGHFELQRKRERFPVSQVWPQR